MTGDVFLMEGTTKFAPYLMTGQKLFIYDKTRSTHVMFSFGGGIFVHSTAKPGVEIISYREALPECKEGWRVIRNTKLTEDQRGELQKASIFYLQQGYNFSFMAPSNGHSSFCSELVAKIYDKAGIPLFDQDTGKVAPGHFDRVADEADDWLNVTDEYKAGFAQHDSDPRQFDMIVSMFKGIIQKRSFMLQRTDEMMAMAKNVLSPESFNNAYVMEANFRKIKNISFWNETLYPPPPAGEANDLKSKK